MSHIQTENRHRLEPKAILEGAFAGRIPSADFRGGRRPADSEYVNLRSDADS